MTIDPPEPPPWDFVLMNCGPPETTSMAPFYIGMKGKIIPNSESNGLFKVQMANGLMFFVNEQMIERLR